ncbi:ABC transporter substrate-binding protein [Bifidobacterium primatium]|uniref:ABC transporter substrate-binding protein n=1 Tax=Bifidobacterium primatium TaxID=2045438 RepID=A0A2M9H6V0_9BIFI|nr:ABC transporter substrate-binding protein [Bifidobacterium primatium]PJM72560.1 ABC transporter substrate-binding protein [Bifidobacterium primatium]
MNAATRKFRSVVAATAAVLIAATTLAGCGGSSASSKDADAAVSIGVEPWLGYAPWYIAEKNGYFKDQNVKATITNFDTDSDMNAAIAAGKIQAGNVGTQSALQMLENKVDVSVVMVLDASETADAIISDGSVSGVADLKGKSVAYEEGSTSDVLLNYALEEQGLGVDDIKKVPMSASSAGTAVIAGKVPAAVTYEPYITEARRKDPNIKVVYTPSAKEGLISDVLVVRNDFIKNHPDQLTSLLKAWDQSIDFYDRNTDEGQEIIATAIGSKKEDLKTAFAGVKYFTAKDNASKLDGDFKSTFEAVNKASIKAKIVSGTLNPDDYVNAEFATKAAK